MAAFRELSLCGKNGCRNRPEDKPLRSIGKAATSVLPPSKALCFFFKNKYGSYRCLSGRASVRSRRSAAEDSSSSRSRLVKSNGRFAPLDLKQDCFFRVPLPKIKCLVQFAFGGQHDFHPTINLPKAPFQIKVADALPPLEFEK